MLLQKLVLFFLFLQFASASGEIDWPRYCTQCVAGEFMKMRWLMQHLETRQSFAWMEAWENTDCETGVIKTIGCYGSCLTIRIWRENETDVAGYMQDCSDEIIFETPDLPHKSRAGSFYEFHENGTYTNVRLNHTLTYIFSTVGIEIPNRATAALYGEVYNEYFQSFKNREALYLLSFGAIIVCMLCIVLCCFGNNTVEQTNDPNRLFNKHRASSGHSILPSTGKVRDDVGYDSENSYSVV